MPTIPYNDKAVKSAKPRGGKRAQVRIVGGGCPPGFVLDLLPKRAGKAEECAAVYRLVYHVTRPGKRRTLRKFRIGTRGVTPLHEARERAIELRQRVERGEDPAAERQAERHALTFRQLAEQRLAEDENLAASTKAYHRWAFERYVYPAFGDHAAAKVNPRDVVDLVDGIAKRDALVTADRVKGAVSGVFTWAMRRLLVPSNPCAGLGRRSTSLPREHILSDADLRATLRAIEASDLGEPTQLVLKLLLYTGQRSGEVIGARLEELHLGDAHWIIPGKVRRKGKAVAANGRTTKSGNEQRVPLPRQAVTLFRRAIELAGDEASHVFPAVPTAGRQPAQPHLDRHSISRAMARLRERFDIEDATPHDFRRTCATWLGEQGIRPDVIETLLNHTPQGITRRVYNRAKLEPMVRDALEMWADHVDDVAEDRKHRGERRDWSASWASGGGQHLSRQR